MTEDQEDTYQESERSEYVEGRELKYKPYCIYCKKTDSIESFSLDNISVKHCTNCGEMLCPQLGCLLRLTKVKGKWQCQKKHPLS